MVFEKITGSVIDLLCDREGKRKSIAKLQHPRWKSDLKIRKERILKCMR